MWHRCHVAVPYYHWGNMSDSSTVNETIRLIKPHIERQAWSNQTVGEDQLAGIVRRLRRQIYRSKPEQTDLFELKRYFNHQGLGRSCQLSALREACREIVSTLELQDVKS